MATHEQVLAWNEVRGQGIEGELYVVLELWSERPFTDSTSERLAGLISRFTSRLVATGVTSLADVKLFDCESFIWARTRRSASPSMHTVHLRRTAVHGLFNALHQLDPTLLDPTRGLEIPPKGDRRARALTDHELTNVRIAALGRVRSLDRASLAVALAESTATSGEIPQVRWRHVDLAAGTVALPGAMPIRARIGVLSPWGISVLTKVWNDTSLEPNDFVVSRRGDYADPHSAQAAVSNLLAKILRAAGAVGDDIRPTSIRLWGGACVLEADGIVAAAAAMGITSLDAARRSLQRPTANS